ncbi:hypothetical protein FA95DRAFT_1474948, partial [Auriscalpium vulgare]
TMSTTSLTARFEQSSVTKPPVLTAGNITPVELREFKYGCEAYHKHKGIPPEAHTRMITDGFQDPRIREWIRNRREFYEALPLAEFLEHVSRRWLQAGWELRVSNELLNSRQKNRPFNEWQVKLSSKNTLLVGTPSHLDDDALRRKLQAGMNIDLGAEVVDALLPADLDLQDWLDAVEALDAKRIRHLESITSAVARYRKEQPSQSTAARSASASASTQRTGSSSSARTTGRCPALTDEERALLDKHEGCLKCRRPYAGHRSVQCTNGFPAAEGYKPLTEAAALKAATARPATKARSKPLVAAVLPSAEESTSGVIGDGSDSD